MHYLIGTVHRDPSGLKRLEELLRNLQPDIITVEVSPVSLSWRRDNGTRLKKGLKDILIRLAGNTGEDPRSFRKHPSIDAIFRMINIPYEYMASWKYTRSSGAPLIMVDDPDAALKRLQVWETELLVEENIKNLLDEKTEDWQKQIDVMYETALNILHENENSLISHRGYLTKTKILEELNSERDAYMAERIIRLLKAHPDLRLCHIGGWEHLVEIPENLSLSGLLNNYGFQHYLLDRNVTRLK